MGLAHAILGSGWGYALWGLGLGLSAVGGMGSRCRGQLRGTGRGTGMGTGRGTGRGTGKGTDRGRGSARGSVRKLRLID